ncbi:hypothetical protein [Burkholderia ubonensis]|uniref:Uncharacterized protein n=1 Tax=Burkholderia ubonensis TaxID=101571 RepID=A0ABD4E618_9BURK|nr:hypothetical protein [Burkholderia ubonensis]KVN88825.1 hypothetical protein WJ68_04615 [Burkholderia ubonensis]
MLYTEDDGTLVGIGSTPGTTYENLYRVSDTAITPLVIHFTDLYWSYSSSVSIVGGIDPHDGHSTIYYALRNGVVQALPASGSWQPRAMNGRGDELLVKSDVNQATILRAIFKNKSGTSQVVDFAPKLPINGYAFYDVGIDDDGNLGFFLNVGQPDGSGWMGVYIKRPTDNEPILIAESGRNAYGPVWSSAANVETFQHIDRGVYVGGDTVYFAGAEWPTPIPTNPGLARHNIWTEGVYRADLTGVSRTSTQRFYDVAPRYTDAWFRDIRPIAASKTLGLAFCSMTAGLISVSQGWFVFLGIISPDGTRQTVLNIGDPLRDGWFYRVGTPSGWTTVSAQGAFVVAVQLDNAGSPYGDPADVRFAMIQPNGK